VGDIKAQPSSLPASTSRIAWMAETGQLWTRYDLMWNFSEQWSLLTATKRSMPPKAYFQLTWRLHKITFTTGDLPFKQLLQDDLQ